MGGSSFKRNKFRNDLFGSPHTDIYAMYDRAVFVPAGNWESLRAYKVHVTDKNGIRYT